MMKKVWRKLDSGGLLIGTLGLSIALHSAAQSTGTNAYPSKPVTIIVPYDPGGGLDTEMRLYRPVASEVLGKPVLIDNKAGAGTTLGTAFAARSAPDGHTLLMVGTTFTISATFYEGTSTAYNAERDFAPISLLTRKPWVIVANLTTPYNNMTEYIAYARAHPFEVNFSHSGVGSLTHFPGVWLHSDTKTKVTFVGYKNSAARLLDLTAGRVQVCVVTMLQGMSLAKAGKLKVLGLINDNRSALYPDLKTLNEQGITGIDYQLWLGLVGPRNTPPEIVGKIDAAFQKALKDPAVQKKLVSDGTEIIGEGPAALQKLISAEVVRYKKLIQENNIKVEE